MILLQFHKKGVSMKILTNPRVQFNTIHMYFNGNINLIYIYLFFLSNFYSILIYFSGLCRYFKTNQPLNATLNNHLIDVIIFNSKTVYTTSKAWIPTIDLNIKAQRNWNKEVLMKKAKTSIYVLRLLTKICFQ